MKKIIGLLLVVCMVISANIGVFAYTDVEEGTYVSEAITVLSSLNILDGYEDGTFRPDETVTRAQMAKIICEMLGYNDLTTSETTFEDVPLEHWAAGYIGTAQGLGIVKGYGNGKFGPEDEVTYEQAVKMVVAALGFEPAVNKFGGYPSGYLIIASQEGVTKNVSGAAGTPISRGAVAQIVFNALEVKMMEQIVFTTGAEEYAQGNKTILKNYLNIDKYEGVVDSVDYASTADKYDKTTVTITASKINSISVPVEDRKSILFIEGASGASAYLGYGVIAYVGEDEETGDNNVIFAIAPKANKNTIVKVDYSQIEGFEEDVVLEYLVKETDKSVTKLELDNPEYYYNGKVDASEAKDFLNGNGIGTVELVDNDNDNQYEYVFVIAYGEDELVGSIDAEEKVLLNADGNEIDIDFEDENVTYSFIKDGAAIAWEDIAVDDVLTFATSADETLVTVYVSSTVIEGVIKEQGYVNGEETYVINGKDYKLTTGANAPTVKVSDSGKFYLNVDGRIAFKEAESLSADNYAYLLAAGIDAGLGSNKVELKFITATGEWKVAEVATRVTVDGTTIDSAKAGTDAGIYTIDAGGELTFVSQLFQFDMNSAGLINRIYTAVEGADDELFSIDADWSADAKTYKVSSNKLGTAYLSEATKVFNVNTIKVAAADESGVTVGTAAFFKDDEDYNAIIYDKDANGYPAVVVVLDANTAIDSATHPMVITKVTQGKNEAGYPVDVFYGYQAGEAVTAMGSEDGVQYFARDDADCATPITASLSAGDVVIFGLDTAGCIANVQILMTADEARDLDEAFFNEEGNGADGLVNELFGFVAKTRSGNRVTIDFFGEEFIETTLKGADLNYYTVNLDRSTPIVNKGNYSDVKVQKKAEKVGSYIYIRCYEEVPVCAVIYNITNENDIVTSKGIE